MHLLKLILGAGLMFIFFQATAQNGPGGIENPSSNSSIVLWLKANALNLSNGASVSTWTDNSTYGNNALTTNGQEPQFTSNSLNGLPSINFIENNSDHFYINDHSSLKPSQISIFVVGNLTNQSATWAPFVVKCTTWSWDDGYGLARWDGNNEVGFFVNEWDVNEVTTNLTYATDYLFTGVYDQTKVAFYSDGKSNGQNPHTSSITNSTNKLYLGATPNTLGTGIRNYLDGEIAEIIIINTSVTERQQILIENYLAAKYDLTLDSNNIFVHSDNACGDFDFDLAGFAQITTADSNLSAQSSDVLTINNPSSLNNNEFFLFAHDNGDFTFTNTSDIPIEMDSRLARTWRIAELNYSTLASVDVGSVDIEIDLTGLTGVNTNNLRLLVDTDNDGSFTDETPIKGASSTKANVYKFSGVSAISDSNRISFGIKTSISWDGNAFENGSGANETPAASDSLLNFYILSANCELSESAHVKNVHIVSSADITLKSGVALTIEEDIYFDGNFILEDGASILQSNNNATNSGSGNFVINRTGNSSDIIYNIWSSPVSSANIPSTFSNANPCDIWAFNAASQAWKYDYTSGYTSNCYGNPVTFQSTDVLTTGDGVMDIGRGYFIPGFTSNTRSFSGTINNGTITVPIETTSLGHQPLWDNDDWNLVGNPYPSAIDAALFWQENAIDNDRITDAVYFWDEADTAGGYNQYADYASWNALGGSSSNNTSDIPSGYIASGQGFWVYAKDNTNLAFYNEMRASNNSQFFKRSQSNFDNHTVQIGISNTYGFSNNILIGYNSYTTNGYDKAYDAHKLSGNAHIKLASLLNNEEFAIQGIEQPRFDDQKIIPLSVFAAYSGLYTFMEFNRNNLSNNYEIHLFDTLTKLNYNLSKEPAIIPLEINTNTNSRFFLMFKHVPTEYDSNPLDSLIASNRSPIRSGINLYQIDEQLYIKNDLNSGYKVQLIDITGKVLNQSLIEQNSITQIAIWNSLSKGTYLVRIENKESVQSLKIVR